MSDFGAFDEPLDLGGELPPPRQQDLRSAGTKLADKLRDLAAHGIQPLTREPARPDLGTCGGCIHRMLRSGVAGKYPKCGHPETPITSGAATDVRASWPACHRFEPKEPR